MQSFKLNQTILEILRELNETIDGITDNAIFKTCDNIFIHFLFSWPRNLITDSNFGKVFYQ